MRLDLFLKKSLVFKQRSLAQTACEKGCIRVNYQPAKPAKEIKIGDLIEIQLAESTTSLKVLEIPTGNVSREKARELYQIIDRSP